MANNVFQRARRLTRLALMTALMASTLSGCATPSPRTARNKPLCPDGTAPSYATQIGATIKECKTTVATQSAPASMPAQNVNRARHEFSSTDTDVPEMFVGLSISGGGSRAATFGMAAMQYLDEIGILQHVTAISTTSGGGMAGAYYAVHGAHIDWQKAHKAMAADYLSAWIAKNREWRSMMNVATTDEDRTDIMTDLLESTIYDRMTYGGLGKFIPGKAPIWLANATELGEARRFTFSEKEFNEINSDLKQFPIAQAVMASAAFPGVFNSVTLNNFQARFDSPEAAPKRYKHLLDGGPTDNLGIEALMALAKSHSSVRAALPAASPESENRQGKCFLIIVDAHPRGVPERYNARADLRGLLGLIVDTNIMDATDAMLMARRRDLLHYLGLEDGEQGEHRAQFQFVDSRWSGSGINETHRIGFNDRIPGGYDQDDPVATAQRTPIPEGQFRCAAWHINLSGLEAIAHYTRTTEDEALHVTDKSPAVREQRELHEGLVSQIDTNFKLAGPRGCKAQFLQEALQAAAFALVMEDYQSQNAACNWLRANKLGVSESCGRYIVPSATRFPVHDRVAFIDAKRAGGRETNAVKCLETNPHPTPDTTSPGSAVAANWPAPPPAAR